MKLEYVINYSVDTVNDTVISKEEYYLKLDGKKVTLSEEQYNDLKYSLKQKRFTDRKALEEYTDWLMENPLVVTPTGERKVVKPL